MSEWKPGDVALAQWKHSSPALAIFNVAHQGWVVVDGAEFDGDEDDLTLRPVAVIDPEDREQVERLQSAFARRCGWLEHKDGERADHLQAALREFANPKPDEPTGLGAVVEDEKGRRWTRYDTKGDPQPWWCDEAGPEVSIACRYAWSAIAAVRVLSDGVAE